MHLNIILQTSLSVTKHQVGKLLTYIR